MKQSNVINLVCIALMFAPFISVAQSCEGSLSPVRFSKSSTSISPNAQMILNAVATQIKDQPQCKVRVTGNGSSSKMSTQISWSQVNSVINFLVEKQGISENRFIFHYGEQGDENLVDLTFTEEEGPQNVPPPFPNLRPKTLSDLTKKPASAGKQNVPQKGKKS